MFCVSSHSSIAESIGVKLSLADFLVKYLSAFHRKHLMDGCLCDSEDSVFDVGPEKVVISQTFLSIFLS